MPRSVFAPGSDGRSLEGLILGHLLHDAASAVSSAGIAIDLLTVRRSGETDAELVADARDSLRWLSELITTAARFQRLARSGGLRPLALAPIDIAREICAQATSVAVRHCTIDCDPTLPSVAVPGTCLLFLLGAAMRQWSQAGRTHLYIDGVHQPSGFMVIDVGAGPRASAERAGRSWSLRATLTLDHLCECLAASAGGRFERLDSEDQPRLRLQLPIAPARGTGNRIVISDNLSPS